MSRVFIEREVGGAQNTVAVVAPQPAESDDVLPHAVEFRLGVRVQASRLRDCVLARVRRGTEVISGFERRHLSSDFVLQHLYSVPGGINHGGPVERLHA